MPNEFGEPTEIELLDAQTSQLKEILMGVKTARSSPDEARTQIVSFCQARGGGGNDLFMKPDPGVEEKNRWTSNVKGSGGGGGDSGGCCVAS